MELLAMLGFGFMATVIGITLLVILYKVLYVIGYSLKQIINPS